MEEKRRYMLLKNETANWEVQIEKLSWERAGEDTTERKAETYKRWN